MKKLEKKLDYTSLHKAMEICTKHLPFVKECKDKRQMVLFTLMDNIDWCKALIRYQKRYGDNEYMAHKATISHDILGLYEKDEFFIPRIS